MIPNIFIGYDHRQDSAYEVCRNSILKTSSGPVNIYKLDHRDLRSKGLFRREWLIGPNNGKLIDVKDNIEFSNEFSHTRFIVPEYGKYLGIPQDRPLMFVDCDFIFLADVYKLFDVNIERKDVYVVKHEYSPGNTVKMDNQTQTAYPKKLWSSLMLFCPPLPQLNIEYVNTAFTSDLHRFSWTTEDRIGMLDEAWNFIPNHSESRIDKPKAIHYTEGVPEMLGYGSSKYSAIYREHLSELWKTKNII